MSILRSNIKKVIHKALYRGGVYYTIGRFVRKRIRILMYHRFSHKSNPGFTSAQELETQLEYLKERFHVVSLGDVANLYSRGSASPEDTIAITVDDGYRDFYEVAYPIFLRHKMPMTLFVCTDFIDQKDWIWTDKIKYLIASTEQDKLVISLSQQRLSISKSGRKMAGVTLSDFFESLYKMNHNDLIDQIKLISDQLGLEIPMSLPAEYCPMTWNQIREAANNGIEIGAHGSSHNILTKMPYDEAARDVLSSKLRIEDEIGDPPRSFCYPNGNTNADVIEIVRNAGFTCAVITQYGFNGKNTNRYSLKRVGVGNLPFIYYVKSLSGFDLIGHVISDKIKVLRG